MQDLFQGIIPPDKAAEALGFFQKGMAILTPYLTPRTPEQRQDMLKMGPATVDFIAKAHGYATANEKFRPVILDMEEFDADAASLATLAPLHRLLGGIDLDVDSTMMTSGSDSYAAALMVYNNVKMLAKAGFPGAQAAYDDMRASLPNGGKGGAPKKPKPQG
ncbi:hypothetical protein Q5H93_10920 [Hymenobacter sp. ASUV-10]|uniref:Uncharacterized protein n=1 Tax=Hymenobacter aranciens TaxID=3063996 RepID=A0ABT9BBT8_9BACT|nr:hypothetical protein [Hymenobacter sp. ASUV-10]MDO7875245.1 hypothetical protein [Hymenobacter sp. ASUV-10]